ncbi:MAG: DUF1275 domain-containing protein [Phycisphaerales bacterium]|nr:DUF1275 domain-containing protein [Phycisphaerales bacterium]
MFVAQAHSFVQQARLAITLAWIAGYTNILTILTCGHVTSHVSGTTSDFGRAVSEGNWRFVAFLGFLLVSFFVGAAVSGFTSELGKRRGWESIYVLPMTIEAILLTAFALLVETSTPGTTVVGDRLLLMTGVASMAMGLQNATITRISSGVVRTTHVTGVLTDLGLEAVQFFWWLADERRLLAKSPRLAAAAAVRAHPTSRRLALLTSIMGSFALGAGLGTLAFKFGANWAMFPPVLFLLWIIYQDISRPIAEIEESELVNEAADLGLPPELAIYHVRKDHLRAGKIHRMPNLLAWTDRLPREARVVILDLNVVTQLDENSAIELRAALKKMEAQGRAMVLTGLTPVQYEQLRDAAGGLLDPLDTCADLELAIARGLNVLHEIQRV